MSILRIVEVRSVGNDMTLMRTWLNHHRFENDSVCQLNDEPGNCFRPKFKVESEAVAFASAFGVELTAKLGS